jgi:hypothetical protein
LISTRCIVDAIRIDVPSGGIARLRNLTMTQKCSQQMRPWDFGSSAPRSLPSRSDAAAALIRYFETVTQSAAIALAFELVMKAAETGAFQDRKAAIDQAEIVLRAPAVY